MPLLPRPVESRELVSLTERLGRLQLLRLGLVLVAVIAGTSAFEVSASALEQLWLGSGAYVVAVALTEWLRRVSRRLSLATLAVMLLVDGLYLAAATYLTGGTQSPLHFLLFVHLIAVTLLASYRTGLKIALWHSLLSIVVIYAQAAGLIDPRESASGVVPQPGDALQPLVVFNVTAFWLVALVTAGFSSLNERELRRRRTDFEALAAMSEILHELRGSDTIAAALLEHLHASFGFGRGVVVGAGDAPALLAQRGATLPMVAAVVGDTALREAAERREPVLLKAVDSARDPGLAALLPDARRLVVIPLIAEGRVLGTVAVEHSARRGWRIERRVVAMLGQFVAYTALALRNAALLERIREMADTDGLTGIPNRRTFDAGLAAELARARRAGTSVTLLMVDVDHFKAFNDRYGHSAGDEALRAVAGTLTDESREGDLVARYGGEEFAVVLPDCPAEEAVMIAERLRAAVSRMTVAAPVTVSVGTATFPLDADDRDGLVSAADAALYASKGSGRNRVTRHERVGAT